CGRNTGERILRAKWFLAAALLGGLTATVSAATPATPRPQPSVLSGIRGRLHVIGAEDDGGNDGRYLPPARYEIEADGQRVDLNINRFRVSARAWPALKPRLPLRTRP